MGPQRLKKGKQGKRTINRISHGLLTTGGAPWPIKPYAGPRSGSTGKTKIDTNDREPNGPKDPLGSKSYNKVHRGDWI